MRDHLQQIVDTMATSLPPRELSYRVIVIDEATVNAAAVPGGAILVFRGLLDGATSENEVAMILGHELAHHHHRDHLERMGRQLVVGAVLNAILGGTTGLEGLGNLGIEGLSRQMGRDDEREADALALDLLHATYGHVGGATAFFERMVDHDVDGSLAWVSTHPLSAERIERIAQMAEERGYRFGGNAAAPALRRLTRVDLRSRLTGHAWTIWPTARHRIVPVRAPESVPWSAPAKADVGEIRLSGRWRAEPCTVAVVVVHGLGGHPDRPYCLRAAHAIQAHGWSSLRLAMRGADGKARDFYHAGLIEDIDAALASPVFDDYERIVLLGYSLGGHVVLRYASERPDPRVRAVAAVCAPLDLDRAARHLDERAWPVYRQHVLRGLLRMYTDIATKRPVPTPPEELVGIDSIRTWDALTVCPRWGFGSPEEYYTTQSVAHVLRFLHVPSLLVVSRHDPMLSTDDVEASIAHANPLLEVRRVGAGGHVAFPGDLDLGEDAPRGLERQVLRWMERRLR